MVVYFPGTIGITVFLCVLVVAVIVLIIREKKAKNMKEIVKQHDQQIEQQERATMQQIETQHYDGI